MVFLQIPDILAKISQHQERKNKERHDKEAKARQDKDTATPHLAPSGARVVPETHCWPTTPAAGACRPAAAGVRDAAASAPGVARCAGAAAATAGASATGGGALHHGVCDLVRKEESIE